MNFYCTTVIFLINVPVWIVRCVYSRNEDDSVRYVTVYNNTDDVRH